ncbi:hypothetical protein NC651_017413 [Populus alba x Populus x berolinensis]|nr:hypothetical protein NC651_017413 [Populus alba x Populus x berolinensis]
MLKLAGCIKLYPLPLALSLSFKFHVEQEEYYPTRWSLPDPLKMHEGLRRSTVLMNFSPTKLDHDVYGLKGCLQGFNWPFATRYMVKPVRNYYYYYYYYFLCLNRTSCRN